MADVRGELDVGFRFYNDTPPGMDPDSHSPTLRRYHKLLWSKYLPNGKRFELEDAHPGSYLYHKSCAGEFFLTSDAITHSYRKSKRISHIINEVPTHTVDSVFENGSTIGAYTIFPGNRIDNKPTINSARGLNSKILDRFDITLECIRRYYIGIESPLSNVFQRYSDFFSLFQDFRGYVDFFLFQDLVATDYSSIKFHLHYECFEGSPLPNNKEEYLLYSERTVNFIRARATRMKDSLQA
jgi:hypothetical protein